MKTKLLFLFLLILRITVYAQNTYVPDDNFEAHLEANGMGNGIANDDYVTTANISGITTLYVDGKSITDLTGIEGFTNLVLLICHTNQLTSLDMSSNLALEYLYCESNNLTNLNVSSNIVLKELQCNNNLLTNLDLNFNTDLYILECTNNQLTNLILNNNVNLRELSCSFNQFTSLDLSFNTALQKLNSAYGQLTTLDLRANTLLTSLNCFANQLTKLDVRNGNNSSIAVFDSTSNPNLTCIKVDDVAYSTTNWTDIDAASSFDLSCGETDIPDDNFETYLEANGMGNGVANDNYVTTANISGVTNLNVSSQNISNLTGIEDFTALTTLYCFTNQLTSLDVSSNTALTYLECQENQLTSLDVSANTILTTLWCQDNLLTSLDVSSCTTLTNLVCQYNQLTSLDVSANTALEYLLCNNNQLPSLDVSTNTALTTLNCGSLYQLASLDVSNNTLLGTLICDFNELTNLDVSTNTALINLNCSTNQLTSLDVRNGNNTAISGGNFNATTNPNLTCILVDDKSWSATNWTNIDPASTFVNDNAECAGVLSVSSNTFGSSFNVYPNPSNGVSKINLGDTYGNVNIQIVDILGKVVDVQKHANTSLVELNTESYTSGIYFIKVESGTKSATIKLVVE